MSGENDETKPTDVAPEKATLAPPPLVAATCRSGIRSCGEDSRAASPARRCSRSATKRFASGRTSVSARCAARSSAALEPKSAPVVRPPPNDGGRGAPRVSVPL
jgi:hypothetical protein